MSGRGNGNDRPSGWVGLLHLEDTQCVRPSALARLMQFLVVAPHEVGVADRLVLGMAGLVLQFYNVCLSQKQLL